MKAAVKNNGLCYNSNESIITKLQTLANNALNLERKKTKS